MLLCANLLEFAYCVPNLPPLPPETFCSGTLFDREQAKILRG